MLCPACVDHYELPGESIERTLARLREHDQRMRGCYARARAAADEYRQQRDSAYRQRDNWREAAIKLVHDHYDSGKGRCVRCGESLPCRPWKLLEDINRGFARKAENWACFSPEELDRMLHPKRRRDADYREDDDGIDDGPHLWHADSATAWRGLLADGPIEVNSQPVELHPRGTPERRQRHLGAYGSMPVH